MAEEKPEKFNPNDWLPAIMALGTWLFCMLQAYRGIHYIPDEWMLTIILSPYGYRVYSVVRDRLTDAIIKRLPKKD